MSLLAIHVLGSPILRQETVPVVRITEDIRRLADDMFETMYAAKGVGLAAPQVGRTERLAVVDADERRLVLVNPEIVTRGGSARGEEGCLSIPEIFGDVDRSATVTVEALGLDGQPFEVEAAELLARCLQHEIDHLHGKLFIDYFSLLKRRAALSQWEREREQYPAFLRTLSPEEIAEHHRDGDL